MKATPTLVAASLVGGMSLLLPTYVLAQTPYQIAKQSPDVLLAERSKAQLQAVASGEDAPSEQNALSQKDWWSATLELSTVLVLGELLYKTGSQAMEDDFDYEIDGNVAEFFYDRLTTDASWKYDDNDIGMNWGHAYAGALYYQAFRNHGFNYYESTLGTFAASTIWEVFAEYKEVVSINDQIVTTWGGAVLGESLFQFTEMLAAKEGWLPTGLSYLFNPSRTVRGWFGYPSPNRFDRRQAQDSFSVYTGVRYANKDKADVSSTMAMLGMRAAIDSREGKYDTLSGTPSRVEMMMETAVSQDGVEEWQMATQLLLASYGRKHKGGGLASDWSHSFYIGPSTGMEYTSLGLELDEDFYAVVNLLGLSFGANWSNQDISIDLRGDLFGDFAMVKPFATKDYLSQGRHFWGTKSVLWEGEYGYTWGHTFNLSLEASYRNLLLGMKLKSQRWSSINDKEKERVPQWNPNNSDLDFDDARDRYEIYLSYGISKDLTLSLHHERIDRSGEIHGIDNPGIYSRLDDSEQRSWLQLDYHY